jgi:hypothetical protein
VWAILDRQGEVLEASDVQVFPTRELGAAFPELFSCLWVGLPSEPRIETALAVETPPSLFVGCEHSWSEVSSLRLGTVRVARYTPPELQTPVWSVDLAAGQNPRFLALVPGDAPLLIVGFHGTQGSILEAQSGRLEGNLTYGRPESEEDGMTMAVLHGNVVEVRRCPWYEKR